MMKHLSKNRLVIWGAVSVLVVGLQVVGGHTAQAVKAISKATPDAKALVAQQHRQTLSKFHNADSLTKTDLVHLLSAVGFTGHDLKEAWAVVMKESRGNPLSHNGNRKTGDNSYGLFQVNMLGSLGQERRDKFNLDYNAELLDPVVNAKVAYHMSKGGKDWSAWKGTHTKVVKFWLTQFPAKAIAKP
jgi:hypothetical protein